MTTGPIVPNGPTEYNDEYNEEYNEEYNDETFAAGEQVRPVVFSNRRMALLRGQRSVHPEVVETEARNRRWVMSESGLDRLVELLVAEFDDVIGPVVESGVIRLRPLGSVSDLPLGITDEQEAGTYRLAATGTRLRFSYSVGPDSLKAAVFPPTSHLWTMRRSDGTLVVDPALKPVRSVAVLGARACDLRGLDVLGRTQTGEPTDPMFIASREGLFLVAVDCTDPAPTCFCGSTPDGLSAQAGYDIGLVELPGEDRSGGAQYVVRVGTGRGHDFVERLALTSASGHVVHEVGVAMRRANRSLIREMAAAARQVVQQPEHPQWQIVADRCLTCGNCTAVCPTCFCTDMSDEVSLEGDTATRTRIWDSCFSMEYSHLGPGPHRTSPKARYRQWLSHKLGTWHDQFDESGCVGCGRCITWCPVGIDLTAEGRAAVETTRGGVVRVVSNVAGAMDHMLIPRPNVVLDVVDEVPDVVTIRATPIDGEPPAFLPAQVSMVGAFGIGEAAISISSSERETRFHDYTIRRAGAITSALTAMKPGDQFWTHEPFGTSWDLDRDGGGIVIAAGGLGLAPLRAAVYHVLDNRHRFDRATLVVGARQASHLLYAGEYAGWRHRGLDVIATVDQPESGWSGITGFVPQVVADADLDGERSTALLCGPDAMMRLTADVLVDRGMPAETIQLTLERNMQCGNGLCGHCQLGPLIVCRDGPVVRYSEVADLLVVEEL